MGAESTVFVVDDDQDMHDDLKRLFRVAGLSAEAFANAQEFLMTYTPDRAGCLVLDVRMPGMSGLDLQASLRERDIHLPVIILTGHGDGPMAIRAMKAGAFDFIEKPIRGPAMLDRVREVLARDAQIRRRRARYEPLAARLALLSPREREILEGMVAGRQNKAIAAELGLSVPTIEAYRSKIYEKLQARSLSELVRLVATYRSYQGKA
jgi:FixJ family two-component response regulator